MDKDFSEFVKTTLSTEFAVEWAKEGEKINEILRSAPAASDYANAVKRCELYANKRIMFMLYQYHKRLCS